LVIVNVSVVPPLRGIDAAPKDLVIDGGDGATTVTDALEVLPVPPSVEVICTELFLVPAVVPVTFVTLNVHEPLAANVPPEMLTAPAPDVAVIAPCDDPAVQFPDRPLGVETTRPAGKVSVKATPVRLAAAFGLVIVNVSVVPPLRGIDAAPNAFAIVGGEMVCAAKGNGASVAPKASSRASTKRGAREMTD
jgi:hypothetical protein